MSYDLSQTNATNNSVMDSMRSPGWNKAQDRVFNPNQNTFKVKSGGFKVTEKKGCYKTTFLTNFEKNSPRVNLGTGKRNNNFYHQSVCTNEPMRQSNLFSPNTSVYREVANG